LILSLEYLPPTSTRENTDLILVLLIGRFIPQKFEEVFTKWDKDGDDKLNFWDMWRMTEDLRVAFDFFGWFAAKFEWITLWLLASDENGMVSREDIRGCFDGSLFYRLEQREKERIVKKRELRSKVRQEKKGQ
jgi:peroxygenase